MQGESVFGLGYMLNRESWGKGYATEGAKACLEFAFTKLNAGRVICDMRPFNEASINVAKRLGMMHTGEFIKHYYGKDMPHFIYEITKEQTGF